MARASIHLENRQNVTLEDILTDALAIEEMHNQKSVREISGQLYPIVFHLRGTWSKLKEEIIARYDRTRVQALWLLTWMPKGLRMEVLKKIGVTMRVAFRPHQVEAIYHYLAEKRLVRISRTPHNPLVQLREEVYEHGKVDPATIHGQMGKEFGAGGTVL